MNKIAICGILFGFVPLSAQDPETAAKQKVDEAMVKLKILGSTMISGPTVKGAPYSAQAVSERSQTLADGNRITSSSSTTLYRDGQGRERREEPGGREIVITDPVEGVSYTLDTKNKTARKDSRHNVGFSFTTDGQGEGRGRGGAVTTTSENRVFIMNSTGSGSETFVFNEERSSKADSKIKHLGTQMIEGVAAEGTRTSVTIPAGQIGNELPITTVNERWYSPDLQVVVKNTRSDPRTGTSTYTLTNINRGEPSPTLFQVPPDYTINDMSYFKTLDRPEERQ